LNILTITVNNLQTIKVYLVFAKKLFSLEERLFKSEGVFTVNILIVVIDAIDFDSKGRLRIIK